VATASENGKAANPDQESHEPRECMPCRGTGKVTSNLGGTPKEVICPWCEGGGVRRAGIDAQAHWPHAASGSAGQVADVRQTGGAADDGPVSAAGAQARASEAASEPN